MKKEVGQDMWESSFEIELIINLFLCLILLILVQIKKRGLKKKVRDRL